MMLGGGGGLFGKKKKQGYSWMTGGAASGTSTPSRPSPAGATPAAISGGRFGPGTAPVQSLGRGSGMRMGEWREDGDKGAGIQIRDFLGALEEDGKGVTVLPRLLAKLKDA
jgi:hypothetical protein